MCGSALSMCLRLTESAEAEEPEPGAGISKKMNIRHSEAMKRSPTGLETAAPRSFRRSAAKEIASTRSSKRSP